MVAVSQQQVTSYSLLTGGCGLNPDICICRLLRLTLVLVSFVIRLVYPSELFLWVKVPSEIILTSNPFEALVFADCRNLDRSTYGRRSGSNRENLMVTSTINSAARQLHPEAAWQAV